LPLCVIDAVFSIGVNYAGTAKVVQRFGVHFGLPCLGLEAEPPTTSQLSTSDFLALYARHGIPYFTDTVYQNRQRTSTTNGILKADAVLRFSEVLHAFQVEYLQDVARVRGQKDFETAILGAARPIQRSMSALLLYADRLGCLHQAGSDDSALYRGRHRPLDDGSGCARWWWKPIYCSSQATRTSPCGCSTI
jgi:hypothetical protein